MVAIATPRSYRGKQAIENLPTWDEITRIAPVATILIIVSGLTVWAVVYVQGFAIQNFKRKKGKKK